VSDDTEREETVEEKAPINRRSALKVLGVVPLAGALGMTQQGQQAQQPRQTHEAPNQPARNTRQAESQPQRRFFTAREYRTVGVLADDILPRDERSGSATEAGVPAFIDFNLSVEETSEDTRTAFRGGLRWLDTESRKRFKVPYASATRAQRHQILDDISWPSRSRPEFSQGTSFFVRFRDMAASGFFSSAMGWKDLQYMGHVFVPEWKGCPPAALRKLGVSYE
jgi:gluconate 2-dehydrogenase gamma chain